MSPAGREETLEAPLAGSDPSPEKHSAGKPGHVTQVVQSGFGPFGGSRASRSKAGVAVFSRNRKWNRKWEVAMK